MSYQDSFNKLKKVIEALDASNISEHLAYQFDIIGDDEGIFYVEISDGKIIAQPFDYKDNTAELSASSEELKKFFEGKDSSINVVNGNIDILSSVIRNSSKKAEKTTSSKPAAKAASKTTKSTAKKSTTKSTKKIKK